ncbi:MAG TPA: hypothetical protein VL157_00810 [Gemmatimonadaceae bacterium]|jgi:hypothetical protein|nr:hypothetical protein [Gemmatimonadaceae bacterium]
MTTSAQAPVAARTMAEFIDLAGLGDDAKAALAPAHGPRQYVQALLDQKLYPDAVRFLAHALPKREGIWWAWVCARRASSDAPAPLEMTALDATEKWITQPTDENRRAAMRAAEAAGLATPAGCTALAAFVSGGSLGPANTPPVPPGEFLTAKAITGAVVSAAVGGDAAKAPERYQGFIAQGLDVVNRLQLWGRNDDA